MSERLWNALGSALYPRWLWTGPYWWRSLNAWWLGWWGAAFFHTDPWRPFRLPRPDCTCGALSRKHMHASDCPAQTEADRAMHSRIAARCPDEECERGVLVVGGELVDCPICWPSGGPLGGPA